MTHPLVWYVFPDMPIAHSTSFVLSELFAWIAEALFYALADVSPSKLGAFAVSALANGASLGLGYSLL
jgi:hypothetical protein